MTYSVSEKSHTTSTSISQGGLKPKKRPTSSSQDPSKPVPIFRTASALHNNRILHNAQSTVSELTGLDSVSISSNGRRNSMGLSTIQGSVDSKAEKKGRGRSASPFGRRRSPSPFGRKADKSVDSAHTKSSKQNSVTHSEMTHGMDNRQKEKIHKKQRGISLRSLSPFRRRNKKKDDYFHEEHERKGKEKEKYKGRYSRGRSRPKNRPSLQKTPSQILLEDERAETAIPLVAVSPSHDSSEAKKPKKFSFRSFSPFRRRNKRSKSRKTRGKKKKNQKADPFYEDDSL